MSLEVLEVTGDPPVTLTQAKAHLGIIGDDSDSRLTPLLSAAIATIETQTRRAFRTQRLRLRLGSFPERIRLPKPSVISIESLKYIATSGTLTTLSTSLYVADLFAGEISPAYGQSWPSFNEQPGAVRVEYTSGPRSLIEDDLKAAILLQLEELYDGSSNELRQLTIANLVQPRIEQLSPSW